MNDPIRVIREALTGTLQMHSWTKENALAALDLIQVELERTNQRNERLSQDIERLVQFIREQGYEGYFFRTRNGVRESV